LSGSSGFAPCIREASMNQKDMLAKQRQLARQLVDQYASGSMNRRDVLKRAGMLGLSVPALTAALSARGISAQEVSPAASPMGSPGASPAAEENLELGDYSGETLRVSVALDEAERPAFDEVV